LANSNAKQLNVIGSGSGGYSAITLANIQPTNPITIGTLNSATANLNSGMTIDKISEWDWNLFNSTDNVKKYEVFETTEDILALSVTWHRLRPLLRGHSINNINIIDPWDKPTKLTDEILFKQMTQEDRERANVIRDYYSKKIMMFTLRGQHLTKFRKDLSTFVHGDSQVVKEEMLPLVYRLPEFYDYDIELEEMFRDLNTTFQGSRIASAEILSLTPIKKFTVKRKSRKFVEYWLKDENNIAYKIEIDTSNELLHLWDHFFEKKSVTLDSISKFTERDGIGYNKLFKWSIADFSKI
jgi:hypothetical protein